MSKLIKRTALALGGFFLLVVGFSIAASVLFEDDIKAKVSELINDNLRAPFEMEDMQLNVLSRFPSASVHLEQVLIKEALPDKVFADTLLFANDLYLEFSLFNLLSGDISIDAISADQVLAKPAVEKDGSINYQFWKTDSTENSGSLALEHIALANLKLSYSNLEDEVFITAHAEQFNLAGLFNDQGERFDLEGQLNIDSLHIRGTRYVSQLPTEFDLAIELPSNKEEYLHIADGAVHVRDMKLRTDLSLKEKAGTNEIMLRLKGEETDLEGAASLIPGLGNYLIDHYGIKGEADLDILYAGSITDRSMPTLDVRMTVSDGKLTEKSTGVAFSDIALEGGFVINGQGVLNKLDIERVSASAVRGRLSGNLHMAGTTKAQVKGSIKSNVDLGNLFRFAQYDGEVEGKLKLNSEFSGQMDLSNGFSKHDMHGVNVIGTAVLGDASFQLSGMRHGFEHMNAQLTLEGNDAKVKQMSARLIEDDIRLDGALNGLVNYLLFDDQTLEVIARVEAEHLDLEKAILTTDDQGDEERELVFPNNVNVDLNVKLSTLDYASFHASDVHGRVRLQNGKLVAKPIAFNTSEGGINASFTLNTSSSGAYPFEVNASLVNINVKTLFDQFDQFGQQFITSSHLHGTMNAEVHMSTLLERDMHIDTKALASQMEISITNGELIGHGPMIEIADHVRKNALYSAFIRADELEDRLKHIRFEELSNTIRIANEKVYVPNMEVRSTAMNVNIAGEHGFDDQVDHHVYFRLAELFNKKNKDSEFGQVQDDGTGSRIFLRMHGHTSDLQIENDRKALAEYRKNRAKERNQELKDIITNPFKGKKDDKPADEKSDGPTFNVEFDDGGTNKPKKKKKGLGKFLTQDEDQKKSGVSFSVDDDSD